jgi:hypothetical protein
LEDVKEESGSEGLYKYGRGILKWILRNNQDRFWLFMLWESVG